MRNIRLNIVLGRRPSARKGSPLNGFSLTARIVLCVFMALLFWIAVEPNAPTAAVLGVVAAPLVLSALAVRRVGVASIEFVSLLLLVSSFGLLLNATSYADIIDWKRAAIDAGIAGAALALACAAVSRAELVRRPAIGLLLLAATFLYALGTTLEIDRRLDTGSPQTLPAEVVRKHVRHGRSTHRWLSLAPNGVLGKRISAEVSPAVYEQARIGTTLCIRTHAGALGIAYRDVAACPSE